MGKEEKAELWRLAYWMISSNMGRMLSFRDMRGGWAQAEMDRAIMMNPCLYLSEDRLDSAHVHLEVGSRGVNLSSSVSSNFLKINS